MEEMCRGSSERKTKILAIISVIGCMFLTFSVGLFYIFGNYTVYVTSYLRNRTLSSGVTYDETTWILTSGTATACLAGPFLGLLERILHYKLIIGFASLVFSGGVLATYYAVQYSIYAVIMTYGVCFGLGKVLIYTACLKCAMLWFPNRSGLVNGLVLGGYGSSSFIFNWVVTEFINPDNVSPDKQVGEDKYFTQRAILDKVPSSFLLLGGTCLSLQIIGLFMLSDASKYKKSEQELLVTKNNSVKNYSSINDDKVPGGNMDNDELDKLLETVSTDDQNKTAIEDDPSKMIRNFEVKDVLTKSKAFYFLWTAMLFFEYSLGIVVTGYKTYGQTFIKDDEFFALIGSVSSIFNAAGRLFWGAVADKFTPELTLSLLTASFSIFLSTLNLVVPFGRYVYFLWICLITFSFCGIFPLVPSIVFRSFGSRYFLTIVNMVLSAGVISSMTLPFLLTILQPVIGWNNIFVFASGTATIVFLLSLIIERLNWRPKQV